MSDDSTHILVADWTWTGQQFVRDVAVHVGSDGRIAKVAPLDPSDKAVTRLANRALLPGFVNAHSHAFQRGLRSEPQHFDSGAGDFWSWRQTMYRLAESLDVDRFYAVSKQCFCEMLSAGITSVGEFHYLHHAGKDHNDWAFDDAILAAARDAGIRIVLIQTYYATGAISQPLAGAQQRFGPVAREEFLRQMDRLATKLNSSTQSRAVACHSIRAASLEDLVYMRDFSHASKIPFHMHVEETQKEIEECFEAYGTNPMKLLLERIRIDEHMTAIHCTHSKTEQLREWAARGGRICRCPITEANLGDGLPSLEFVNSCIGTDSNIRVSMTEELRWLEFAQRLLRQQRGIVVDDSGSNANALMKIGTINGAASLALTAGRIEAGAFADLISIDLDHDSMRGCTPDSILDSLIFGCGNGPIDRVWVGGKPRDTGAEPCQIAL